jgi:hypothetical protein
VRAGGALSQFALFDALPGSALSCSIVAHVTPTFTVRKPQLFTSGAVLISSLYGFILCLPVLISVFGMTLLHFSLWTFLVPVVAIGAATFVLPLGFGNPYISRLVRPLRPVSDGGQNDYVVQFSCLPRIRSGLLSVLEDADDVGVLIFTDTALEFYGDSVRLSVPFSAIKNIGQQNAGARALFAYGHQLVFSVPSLNVDLFRFAERSSWVLTSSRRTANRMYQQLSARVANAVETTRLGIADERQF